jgi:hypothetical protein
VVRTTTSGDWSTYVLRLLGDDGQGFPDGFDAPLARAPFSFTVDCPSDLDCRHVLACPPGQTTSPVQDYLARDYDAMRTRLLDRLSALLPGWSDRSPADTGVMLVELFAYLADRLAYWQDAVAVEAYLGTARRRTSVRRHARLLNYTMHEGCAARAWLAFTTDTAVTVPAGTPVADVLPVGVPAGTAVRPVEAAEAGAVVVETVADLRMTPGRNALDLHAWGDAEHCLPAGGTSAFLAAPAGAAGPDGPDLRAGDVLVLADVPRGGTARDGDPARRHVVRLDGEPLQHTDVVAGGLTVLEIHWHPDDALTSPLPVSEPGPDGAPVPRAVALANIALADHGASVTGEPLDPPEVPAAGAYRPRLLRTGLAWADPLHAFAADVGPVPTVSAAASARPDPRTAVAQVVLDDGERSWTPVPDLLASGRLATHVVVEQEADGVARLRFGDGLTGRRPTGGTRPRATYRVGGGAAGNVAAGRLTRLLARPDGAPAVPDGVTATAWNPLPATGGADPELLDEVRAIAPQAFRRQLRAVTSDDYAAVAAEQPGAQQAVARRRWTGSWYAQEVTVDPIAARAADPALEAEIAAVLEVRRLVGVDVELAPPLYVPLHLVLSGCVGPGYLRAELERTLLDVLSARVLPAGRRGLFHPDAVTFGQPLFLSDVVAAAMAVPGLLRVEVDRFARMDAGPRESAAALALGRIDVAAREVLRCDSDPGNPEAGRVDVVLRGGS